MKKITPTPKDFSITSKTTWYFLTSKEHTENRETKEDKELAGEAKLNKEQLRRP